MSLLVLSGFIMSVVYIALGIFLLAAHKVLNFTTLQQNGIGAILILYGFVRFYAAWKKKVEIEREKNNEE